MRSKYLGVFLAVLIVLSSVPYVVAEPNTTNDVIYVSADGNDNNTGLTPENSKKTIQNAIKHVKSGGTIHIQSGTYKETLIIDKYVRLVGEGPDKTILNADYKGSCISIKPWNKVLIEGVTVTRGYGWRRGGGIYNDRSTVTIKNCIISGNSVWWEDTLTNPAGGGIYNYYGDMDIENSIIQHNEITYEGAGISSICSHLVIKDSIIQNNHALEHGSYGGGVYVYYGSVVLENTIIRNNYASCGGGLYLWKTDATLKNCVIQNNTAHAWDGGISLYYNYRVDIDDATRKRCVNNSAPNYPNGYGI